jgi:hypothetical protein
MATLAVFIALGGVSYAVGKGSIGSREIRDDAVRGIDVRDGDLSAEDFAAGQLPAGERGPIGPQGLAGPSGVTGPKGDSGAHGATGERGPAGFSDSARASGAASTPPSTTETDTFSCPGSHPEVTGGGYEISSGFESFAKVIDSRPLADGTGWSVRMQNLGGALPLPYTIWAVCVQ